MVNRMRGQFEAAGRFAVDPRIPLYIVTGSNGDLQTSALQRFAHCPAGNLAFAITNPRIWRRITAGATNVSALQFMACQRDDTLYIDAGTDPINSLYQLHLRRLGLLKPRLQYDAVVFDTSNIQIGSFVAVVQNDTRIEVTYRIAGILHVVDFRDRPFRKKLAETSRICTADTIILTLPHRVQFDEIEDAKGAISSLNPFARIVIPKDSETFTSSTLGSSDFAINDNAANDCGKDMIQLPSSGAADDVFANNLYSDSRSNTYTEPPVRALDIQMPGEVDLLSVMRAIEKIRILHGPDLLRLSAVLNIRHADYPIAMDIIGGTLLHPAYHCDARRDDSRIRILARGLNVPRALDAIGGCSLKKRIRPEELRAAM